MEIGKNDTDRQTSPKKRRSSRRLQEKQKATTIPVNPRVSVKSFSSKVESRPSDQYSASSISETQSSALPFRKGASRASKEDSKKKPKTNPMEYILTPATPEERQKWKGWCEIESEPAFFNVMLREFGAKGIKVQEVFSLDESMLDYLSKPIFGLVFLFQFREDDPSKQEAVCPEHIWFANQTMSNSCASIALLNIIMNVPDIDLGPTLNQLKEFSLPLTPGLRGYTVGNHDFLRQIHNSFTRKMDWLDADLFLSKEANTIKSKSQKHNSKRSHTIADYEAGFHFIAFAPIGGCVWKLDGLERQPMNLGKFESDWMDIARPLIAERMEHYESGQIQFNLLSICRSPLLSIPESLSISAICLHSVDQRLDGVKPDWRQFVEHHRDDYVRSVDTCFGITQDHFNAARMPPELVDKLSDPSISPAELLTLRQDLIESQAHLRASYAREIAAVEEDNEKARGRRHDYTPLIHMWIRMLAEKGILKDLVKETNRKQN